jgi:hypothetical protein
VPFKKIDARLQFQSGGFCDNLSSNRAPLAGRLFHWSAHSMDMELEKKRAQWVDKLQRGENLADIRKWFLD